MDARLGSVDMGASRLPLGNISQSSVLWRKPHVFRIRSDISLMSDDELPESKAELFLDLDKKLHDNDNNNKQQPIMLKFCFASWIESIDFGFTDYFLFLFIDFV